LAWQHDGLLTSRNCKAERYNGVLDAAVSSSSEGDEEEDDDDDECNEDGESEDDTAGR
jgi:hypothetical protein